MASKLTAAQATAQGDSWKAYAAALQKFQTQYDQQDDYDTITSAHYIGDALQIAKQYYLNAILAAYADADAAFTTLQDVTQQATSYVKSLKGEAAAWTTGARIFGAVESLAVALEPPFNASTILSAASGLKKALPKDNATS